ncbi:tRNA (N6-threonylcarbamoyladenosine(37)-N6)-methyltransferase TrmO [Entomomonas sp. E2T0]|uniref:tRNA (N6-threonylcarbamoyladenosine(37)-N6)-methyltransferase TrmO n=1 Tax=Entomomonas sp. E2T0 TaxID=2930213 RepID=UPI0022281DD5|nr:tRNA (N6-threonylcarbamoyladenosine(37)-N6)-methyltransferase TrmO [Entomomonas sp. E2T0]UYZ85108.1 tRNA (N6-threonylcarbamoyladenosine(37)-N6)-methyltransferase TrmO [Entomomonas sp. E2T0]
MYQLEPIGYIHSCFKEKFTIPRQPLLAPAATGVIELLAPYNQSEALAGLEQISHLWLLFIFHQTMQDKPRLKVRPPRLGGNKSLGVFATRSTFRPNNIGQSVVKLEKIVDNQLFISGIDLLDGTPIIDIKPYVPYADIVTEATNNIAPKPPKTIQVIWTTQALKQAKQHEERLQKPLQTLIEQCLSQDPKPAYQQPEPTREYGTLFWDVNVKWHYPDLNTIEVLVVSHQLTN